MNHHTRTPWLLSAVAALLLPLGHFSASAFSIPSIRRSFPSLATSSSLGASSDTSDNADLKADLLKRIETLRTIKERDGDFSVDFGVKGGEIDKKSRAPQKVNFYSISDDAGKAADAVMETADQLASNNPSDEPTLYLGDKEKGDQSPLNGEWKLLFTTAADATFSKNSTRGAAAVKNVVDAKHGRITNVIDFPLTQNGTEPVLKQLNVVIGAKAAGKSRVELRFRYAKAVLTKFLWWKRQWSLYIPVPAPFITRLIVFFGRIFRFGRKDKKVPPKAYFDVLYLDDQLRIHRTGEDNFFVQAKETAWEEAKPFLT
ncbi:hypothetical protein ACHAXR_011857 [Thalassiosira sp. AJA248-18]